MRVLVVGATGALRPAVERLAAGGHHVFALSRRPDAAASLVTPVAADVTDEDGLYIKLSGLPLDAALVYAPAASPAARRTIADAVTGLVVELLTSAHADPARNPSGAPESVDTVGVPLLLGWHAGTGRWHTAQELSEAALAMLDDPRPRTLGVVRPWSDRPS